MRVLVVADNILARTGLAALLDNQPDVDIAGLTALGPQLSDDLDLYRPEVVVIDLGYQPALAYLALLDDMPVVALAASSDDARLAAGALGQEAAYGLMLRDCDPAALTQALRTVHAGLVALDPPIAAALLTLGPQETPTPAEALTPREAEVLQLIAEGLPNKLIAQRLGISPNTVKFHINAILSKLGVQSRTEAVVRATRLGWVIL